MEGDISELSDGFNLIVNLEMSGPGTVVCDYMSYSFMFLSIATSNMVATALAKKV
jgi:hypothetical protein